MKTSKLVMIASIVAVAVLSISVSPNVNAKQALKDQRFIAKSHYMNFEQAVQNPGILREMYEQIENNFLPPMEPYFTAQVSYRGSKLYITGSYEQWYFFFKDKLRYNKNHQQ